MLFLQLSIMVRWPHSQEAKEKISKLLRGRPKSLGVRVKMAQSHKRKMHTEVAWDKIARWNVGRKLTPKTWEKMAMAKRGKKLCYVTKKKIREAVRERHTDHKEKEKKLKKKDMLLQEMLADLHNWK